jgi:hypothetical protein
VDQEDFGHRFNGEHVGGILPGLKEKSWEEAFTFCLVPCIHDESGKSVRMSHPYYGGPSIFNPLRTFASEIIERCERSELARGGDSVIASYTWGTLPCLVSVLVERTVEPFGRLCHCKGRHSVPVSLLYNASLRLKLINVHEESLDTV